MASLPIIFSTFIYTYSIAAPAKETHPKEIFQSEYEKF